SIAMIAKVPNLTPHEKSIYEKIPTERGQATLIIGFDAPTSYDEKDKWALRAAAGLLSAGSLNGWLYDELRGKRNLVYIAWASLSSMKHGGTFTITTQCAPEEFDTVYTIINNLIERLRKGDFAEEELKRIENSLAEKHDMAFQTQADFVNTMALDELYGFGFNYYTKYGERIKSVSKEDVVNAAKKYLANPVTLVLMPKEYEN
ncbi:MAG TPA: insulinase family protein, partial [candidate division Zixibacteria bacterium]|nr:insulinase family protein [candidate division Zixibacteria bacterium]